MFSSILSVCFVLVLFFSGCKNSAPTACGSHLMDIEFDEGLGKHDRSCALVLKSPADQKRYRVLKNVWEQNRPARTLAATQPKIPKIIHQIWLGPKHPPRFFITFQETWQRLHPDWEYRLWTDSDAEAFDFELKDLFHQSSNWGEKADILRAEILQAFGGIYIDTDFECLQPFDELVMRYDFFAGIEPPHAIPESDHVLLTSNAIIGSRPNHPIILRWKDIIRSRWQKAEMECCSPIEKVIVRTFLSFGKAVDMEIETPGFTNIVFPSTYFYPIKPIYLRHPPKQPGFFKKMLIAFDVKDGHEFSEIKKESMALHHFAGSWQKTPFELIKDLHKEIVKIKKEQTHLAEELKIMQEKKMQEQKMQEQKMATPCA